MGHGVRGSVTRTLTASAGRRSRFGRKASLVRRTNILCPESDRSSDLFLTFSAACLIQGRFPQSSIVVLSELFPESSATSPALALIAVGAAAPPAALAGAGVRLGSSSLSSSHATATTSRRGGGWGGRQGQAVAVEAAADAALDAAAVVAAAAVGWGGEAAKVEAERSTKLAGGAGGAAGGAASGAAEATAAVAGAEAAVAFAGGAGARSTPSGHGRFLGRVSVEGDCKEAEPAPEHAEPIP